MLSICVQSPFFYRLAFYRRAAPRASPWTGDRHVPRHHRIGLWPDRNNDHQRCAERPWIWANASHGRNLGESFVAGRLQGAQCRAGRRLVSRLRWLPFTGRLAWCGRMGGDTGRLSECPSYPYGTRQGCMVGQLFQDGRQSLWAGGHIAAARSPSGRGYDHARRCHRLGAGKLC
jgi:hypothetical protein